MQYVVSPQCIRGVNRKTLMLVCSPTVVDAERCISPMYTWCEPEDFDVSYDTGRNDHKMRGYGALQTITSYLAIEFRCKPMDLQLESSIKCCHLTELC
ncbi:hypothetical protein J6590_062876 [Homalodisca vitripennis]|nr:hypothetical protein J6590_062876 [Homalodisca vitripennis]